MRPHLKICPKRVRLLIIHTEILLTGHGQGTRELVSSPDPPHHAHFGKLEREKWKEGLVNGLTTPCSSAGMLAELIKT